MAHEGAGLALRLQLLAAVVGAVEVSACTQPPAAAAAAVIDGLLPLLDRRLLQGGIRGVAIAAVVIVMTIN